MNRDSIPTANRQLVIARSRGFCERCGAWTPGELHHRTPKGMGGSHRLDRHDVQNLVHLCPGDHRWIHGNPAAAQARGFLVPRCAGLSALESPVELPGGRRVYLTADGRYEEARKS